MPTGEWRVGRDVITGGLGADTLTGGTEADGFLFNTTGAQLHNSTEGRMSAFPGRTYPKTSVTGMPSALKPFRTATPIWNSAT